MKGARFPTVEEFAARPVKGKCGLCGASVIPPAPHLSAEYLGNGWMSGHHYTKGVLDRVRCSKCGLADYRAEQQRRGKR